MDCSCTCTCTGVGVHVLGDHQSVQLRNATTSKIKISIERRVGEGVLGGGGGRGLDDPGLI